MPTFNDPAADAAEAQQALRGLAHATRSMSDPQEIYWILGSLSAAASSLSQSLHQIAAHQEQPGDRCVCNVGGSRAGRAASYQVSWELHRAGEMLRQVATAIDRAHEIESTITYPPQPTAVPAPTATPVHTADHGLGL